MASTSKEGFRDREKLGGDGGIRLCLLSLGASESKGFEILSLLYGEKIYLGAFYFQSRPAMR
jgi:hypothetical protein